MISELVFVILKIAFIGGERFMFTQESSNIKIEKLLPQLKELSGRFPNVAAYLFGSQISGRPTPLSDVDIGILMDRTLADMESFKSK